MDVTLPPCGIYQTTSEIGSVPAGRLVYFHNHGNPGPGIYLPETWIQNRARFAASGQVLADPGQVRRLRPLAPEGYYRVVEAFHCCDKLCRRFEPNSLVQLGYDATAMPILFSPELADLSFVVPERGVRLDEARIASLAPLVMPQRGGEAAGHTTIH